MIDANYTQTSAEHVEPREKMKAWCRRIRKVGYRGQQQEQCDRVPALLKAH
jgi:hypothetical protein